LSISPIGVAISTLIYDGDCGFCAYWVNYWRQLTGERVTYVPYQEVGAQYPSILADEFQSAVRYVAEDGQIARAAEASLLTLSHARVGGLGLFLYRKLPGFAPVSESIYAFIAARRNVFYRISLLPWGPDHVPAQYQLVTWLFLRGLGLIYFAAFVSFGVQAMGLIGSQGILPLSQFVAAAQAQLGSERYWLLPMLFWLNSSDFFIQAVCWTGAALALLVTVNIVPRVGLFLLYALYLSLIHGGQAFMTYQWDMLLADVGFLGLLLSLVTGPGILLTRWLLFRFMLFSGVVKIASGDSAWQDWTALNYHFETQPLPTPLAWTVHHLPAGVLALLTGLTLFIELVLPFFILLPRRLRFIAAFGILALQTVIMLTGNYNFFNLLVILLCLTLFDDAALQHVVPRRMCCFVETRSIKPPGKIGARAAQAVALFIFVLSFVQFGMALGGPRQAALASLVESIAPFSIVNTYGPFAVMTRTRNEIVIEGSDDGADWKEYAFRYKPGDVTRRPPWNIPHQPRLDWQLWFAALQPPQRIPWFGQFLRRLLEGDPQVTALLETNPFPDYPPRYVRALYYNYRFSSPEEKANGLWWDRELLGAYFPAARLN
jgi:predicted DCC family thiol-disulfide oxidoreductase YuxK